MRSPNSARFAVVPILEHFGAVVKPYSSKLLCPFHDDHNESGWYSEQFQYFKCMACGVRGDAVGLLHRQGGLSLKDAYEEAARIAGEPDEPVRGESVGSSLLPGRSGLKRGSSRYGSSRSGA